MKVIIVSASDAKYFSLLQGLLDSIEKDARRDGIEIGLLDVGLDEEQCRELVRRGVRICKPDLDYDVSLFKELPPAYLPAQAARPHLPKHFPGYDIYLFMDADCWVQDWQAILLYIASATRDGLAITPECDRSYTTLYDEKFPVSEWRYNTFRSCFDEKVARSLAEFPTINSGVFASRADSALWIKWSNVLGNIFTDLREPFFFAEQAALNALIRAQVIPAALLPARCNWMCNLAKPVAQANGSILCEPEPPYAPLGIIHLTGPTKDGEFALKSLEGGQQVRSLRYKAVS